MMILLQIYYWCISGYCTGVHYIEIFFNIGNSNSYSIFTLETCYYKKSKRLDNNELPFTESQDGL